MNAHLRLRPRMIIAAALALLAGIIVLVAVSWALSFTPVWPGAASLIAAVVGSSGSAVMGGFVRKYLRVDEPFDPWRHMGFRATFFICLFGSVAIFMGVLYFLPNVQIRPQSSWDNMSWTVVVVNPLADLIYWICLPCFAFVSGRLGRFRYIMSRD